MQEVQTLFKHHFGHAPTHLVQAPGRVELLGNHTVYNEGLVMSLAVDRYIFIASAPRSDGKIALVSSAFPGKEEFLLSRIQKNPAAPHPMQRHSLFPPGHSQSAGRESRSAPRAAIGSFAKRTFSALNLLSGCKKSGIYR